MSSLYPINSLFIYRFVFMAWLIFGYSLFMYKFERKNYFVLRLLGFVVACFGFAAIFPIPTSNAFYSMGMFLCMFMFTYFASFFVIKVNWKVRLFAMICGYTCEHIAYETYFAIINLTGINKNGFNGLYDYETISLFSGWQDELIYFSTYFIIYWLVFLLFSMRIQKDEIEDSKYNFKVLLAGCFFILTDIVINSTVSWYATIHFENVYVGMIALVNVLCCLICFFYIFEVFYSNNIKNQMKLMEELRQKEINQYKISKETIDMINIKCHDFRHQIRAFGVSQNIDSKTIEELNKLIQVYDSSYHTSNEALNVILREKTLLCYNKGIRFTCIVDGDAILFMEDEDIYSLFGNIIDNAIEAVGELESEEKIISLKIKKVGNMISISAKNGYKGKIEMKNNLPMSKKKNNAYHGFGMKSIQMVCEKYKGNMKVNIDNNMFTLTLLFVMKEEKKKADKAA